MASWSYTWKVDLLTGNDHPQPIYKIEGYKGGIQTSGPIYIDRRKKDELEGFISSQLHGDETTDRSYKRLNAKYETHPFKSKEQIIEIRIYECQEKPHSNNLSQYPPGVLLAESLRGNFENTPENIICYEFTFNFSDRLLSNFNERTIRYMKDQRPDHDGLPSYGNRSLALVNAKSKTPLNILWKSHYYKYIKRISGFKEGRSPLGIRMVDSSGVWKWIKRSTAGQAQSPRRNIDAQLYLKLDGQLAHGIRTRPDSDLTWLGRLSAYYPVTPGWEVKVTNDGSLYYVNHQNESTSWQHPLIENVEAHRCIARRAIEEALDPRNPSPTITENEIEKKKDRRVENWNESNGDIYEEDSITLKYKETHGERRILEWNMSSPLSSNQVNNGTLRDLRDRIDLIQVRQAEAGEKYELYRESYFELSSWMNEYSLLWFPTPIHSTSFILEKWTYLVNRSILLERTFEEVSSLETQLMSAEEEETKFLYQLRKNDTGTFGEEYEAIDIKRKPNEPIEAAKVAANLLDEFPLSKIGEVDTCVNSNLHRDKIPKTGGCENFKITTVGGASFDNLGYNSMCGDKPEALFDSCPSPREMT